MSIIISTNGKNAVRVEKSTFEKEDHIQRYIYDNPESIPLYEVKEDVHLLVLARELSTNAGPIDGFGVDKDGELYIIETKLFKNPDRRTVVAQALDYGAALWAHTRDFGEFSARLDNAVQKKFNLSLTEKLKDFFGIEESEATVLLDQMRNNLNDGKFHFVVPMDHIDDRLRDLILYINQNSQFDIYAIQFEYYKHEMYEIIIPKIFGAEVKKDISVSSSSNRQKWTDTMLMEDAKKNYSMEEFEAFKKIFEFSKQYADEVRLGTGTYGSFSPIFEKVCSKSLYTLSTDGRLSFNFHWIHNDEFNEKYKEAMSALGFTIPENYTEVRPSVRSDEWLPRVDKFISTVTEITKNKD